MSEEYKYKICWDEKDGEIKTAKGNSFCWYDNDETMIKFEGLNGPIILHKNRIISIK